jgi:glycosyltransferase involved in cell wall biosynthesis
MIREGFDFDLIDAHYYYPDGVAAAMLARWFNKPFVVTARGTDLNLIPEHAWPRKLIVETASAAAGSIGVCAALMDELKKLGANPEKLHVMRNGVDLRRFVPEDRAAARQHLGLSAEGTLLVCVGHLIERKGHHLAIEALRDLPECRLAIVGDGEERARLQELARSLGVHDRVVFAGGRPQSELKYWFSAANASLLCSSREGWANVLLESMACGTPVVATNIWGTPEVVQSPVAGRLMARRDASAVRDSVRDLLSAPVSRDAVRAYAEQFSWAETTQAQLRLFRDITERSLNKFSRAGA